MKKIILTVLTVIFLITTFGFFLAFGEADRVDDDCDLDGDGEVDDEFSYRSEECINANEEDAAFNGCCVSFILMCVFGVWAKKVQDAEKLEENLLIAKSMQEAESERVKLESERFRLAQEAEQNRIESAKEAEKMRLRKEIEELEKGLDD